MSDPVVFFAEPNIAGFIALGLGLLEKELRRNGRPIPDELSDLHTFFEATAKQASSRSAATEAAMSGQEATTLGDRHVVSDAPPMAPVLLTYKEVAAALAVSERTVQRLVKERALTATEIGGSRRVHRDDLAAFMRSGRDEDGAA